MSFQKFPFPEEISTISWFQPGGERSKILWDLIQLHHKVETFENLNKHLLLVIQDQLLDYIRQAFRFEHIQGARLGDAMQIHTYTLGQTQDNSFRIELQERFSTDTDGISNALGLNVSPKVELEQIITLLEAKISDKTLLQVS